MVSCTHVGLCRWERTTYKLSFWDAYVNFSSDWYDHFQHRIGTSHGLSDSWNRRSSLIPCWPSRRRGSRGAAVLRGSRSFDHDSEADLACGGGACSKGEWRAARCRGGRGLHALHAAGGRRWLQVPKIHHLRLLEGRGHRDILHEFARRSAPVRSSHSCFVEPFC